MRLACLEILRRPQSVALPAALAGRVPLQRAPSGHRFGPLLLKQTLELHLSGNANESQRSGVYDFAHLLFREDDFSQK